MVGDHSGHCVYGNSALERLTGFNSDQINQADWRSFLLEAQQLHGMARARTA
jgi:hypothetical protein